MNKSSLKKELKHNIESIDLNPILLDYFIHIGDYDAASTFALESQIPFDPSNDELLRYEIIKLINEGHISQAMTHANTNFSNLFEDADLYFEMVMQVAAEKIYSLRNENLNEMCVSGRCKGNEYRVEKAHKKNLECLTAEDLKDSNLEGNNLSQFNIRENISSENIVQNNSCENKLQENIKINKIQNNKNIKVKKLTHPIFKNQLCDLHILKPILNDLQPSYKRENITLEDILDFIKKELSTLVKQDVQKMSHLQNLFMLLVFDFPFCIFSRRRRLAKLINQKLVDKPSNVEQIVNGIIAQERRVGVGASFERHLEDWNKNK